MPVTNSRLADQTVRKRQCVACGHAWFTIELAVPAYAVGWSNDHLRKPVLRVPVELQTGHTRLRASHVEAQDMAEAGRQGGRARWLHVTDCDGPVA